MSLTDSREQIKVILAGVDGIGVIHDYERWAADNVLVVIDRIPDQWVLDMLKNTGCEYVVMSN